MVACQDAAAIFRDTGDRHGEGLALEGPGRVLEEAGRSREAMTAYRDAIASYRETGDQYREGITRENLDRARPLQGPARGQHVLLADRSDSTRPEGFTISPIRPCGL
jgi:hypothetical protein